VSPPSVPGLGAALSASFRLAWVRMVRGRKLRLAIAAVLFVVVASVAARYLADVTDPARAVSSAVRVGFLNMLVFLLPFLFTAGAIAEEVESRTLSYLMIRPAGRVAIALGKYLASAAICVALLAGGVLTIHVASLVADPTPMVEALPDTLRMIGSLSLLALCYCALCMLWGGLVVEAGGLLATLHLAVIEYGFSWLPGVARLASMNHFASELAGFERRGFGASLVPEVDLWVCALVLGVMTLVYLGLATLVVRLSELGSGKA
jgi:ABC-type transport system involved in multi-copper enzyme maturation permease subunit